MLAITQCPVSCLPLLGRKMIGWGHVPYVSDFKFGHKTLGYWVSYGPKDIWTLYGPYSYLWTGSQSYSLLVFCFLLRASQYMWLKTSSPVPHLWKKSSSVREARFVLSACFVVTPTIRGWLNRVGRWGVGRASWVVGRTSCVVGRASRASTASYVF